MPWQGAINGRDSSIPRSRCAPSSRSRSSRASKDLRHPVASRPMALLSHWPCKPHEYQPLSRHWVSYSRPRSPPRQAILLPAARWSMHGRPAYQRRRSTLIPASGNAVPDPLLRVWASSLGGRLLGPDQSHIITNLAQPHPHHVEWLLSLVKLAPLRNSLSTPLNPDTDDDLPGQKDGPAFTSQRSMVSSRAGGSIRIPPHTDLLLKSYATHFGAPPQAFGRT